MVVGFHGEPAREENLFIASVAVKSPLMPMSKCWRGPPNYSGQTSRSGRTARQEQAAPLSGTSAHARRKCQASISARQSLHNTIVLSPTDSCTLR